MRFLFLVGLFICATCIVLILFSGKKESLLKVVFLDVGQGDAIYIETPNGSQVLVDGGRGKEVLRKLSREMGFFDKSLNVVVMTHEDKDHVGGLPGVFERYDVGTFVRTENQGESGAAEAIDMVGDDGETRTVHARRGMTFAFGDGAQFEILFPDRDPAGLESNASSIVMRVVYGSSEFLFTGDSPDEIEQYLISLGEDDLKSDVLKLGHHGSRTSSSGSFLQSVDPSYSIVSAGKDNSYGHPHQEVVKRVGELGSVLLNTADMGSIVFETDGQTLVQKERWWR